MSLELNGTGPSVLNTDTSLQTSPAQSDTSTKIATMANVNALKTSLPFTKEFVSSPQAITVNGSLSLGHGLSAVPKLAMGILTCTSADLNYSVGDKILYPLSPGANAASSANHGVIATVDNTNIGIKYGAQGIAILNKSTGVYATITVGSWTLTVEAWA